MADVFKLQAELEITEIKMNKALAKMERDIDKTMGSMGKMSSGGKSKGGKSDGIMGALSFIGDTLKLVQKLLVPIAALTIIAVGFRGVTKILEVISGLLSMLVMPIANLIIPLLMPILWLLMPVVRMLNMILKPLYKFLMDSVKGAKDGKIGLDNPIGTLMALTFPPLLILTPQFQAALKMLGDIIGGVINAITTIKLPDFSGFKFPDIPGALKKLIESIIPDWLKPYLGLGGSTTSTTAAISNAISVDEAKKSGAYSGIFTPEKITPGTDNTTITSTSHPYTGLDLGTGSLPGTFSSAMEDIPKIASDIIIEPIKETGQRISDALSNADKSLIDYVKGWTSSFFNGITSPEYVSMYIEKIFGKMFTPSIINDYAEAQEDAANAARETAVVYQTVIAEVEKVKSGISHAAEWFNTSTYEQIFGKGYTESGLPQKGEMTAEEAEAQWARDNADDFIWRPGQGMVKINPNDTIVGTKNGFGSTSINIVVNAANVNDIVRVVNDRLARELRNISNSAST